MIKLKSLLDLSNPNVRGYDPAKNQLTSGVTSVKIKAQVAALESEWERLDTQGTGHARQMEIQQEIARLWREKEKWDNLYKAADVPISEEDEHPNDYILLGANWADGTVNYVVSKDVNGRHPASMTRADNRWRYVPEINYLAWWVRPSVEEKEIVTRYLDSKGYNVRHNGALGYIKENASPSRHDDVIFGGIWSNDRIVAHLATNAINYGHTREMGCNRWKYFQEWQTVFWKHFPSADNKFAVENWLAKRGYTVKTNRPDSEYWDVVLAMDNEKKRKKLTENKKLIMEARATPKMLEAFLREMIQGSEWAGKVFLVGGFVRDELLGKEPKDADIVVGKYQGGVEFTTWLGKKLGIYHEKTNPVIFPTFGTANLRLDGIVWKGIDFTGESVDAVMFRKEQYHDPDSRKPTVQYTEDIAEDASRRDLTFNAIYKDISTGKLLDPSGKGISDLKNGIIRTPIDPSVIYTDDALRMFRAVRFATQLGFELSPEVIDGIKNNLHRLGNTSKERVRDELNKILVSKDPTRGIRLLKDTGLLPYVAKELHLTVGMTQNKHHSEDVFSHTLTVLSKTKPSLIARLGALLHDVGKVATRQVIDNEVHFYDHENVGADVTREILTALKYPSNIIEPVVLAVKNHMRLKQGGKDGEKLSDKTLRKFVFDMGEHLEDVLDIVHSDNVAHSPESSMPNQIPNILKRIEQLKNSIPKKNDKLPLSGKDLKLLGLNPGPLFKKLLDLVRDRQMEYPNTTKEEYLEMIKAQLKNEV